MFRVGQYEALPCPFGGTARAMKPQTTVLAYHAIAECRAADDPHLLFVSPGSFEAQMDFLARHRRVVPLADAVSESLPAGKPMVAITFDDGYRSVFDHALPILEQHGFPAAVFVPTAYIGDRNRWDESLPRPLEIMNADELRAADARGLSVESHGHAHIDLSGAPVDDAREDLARSVAILEEVTGRHPRFLAYPFTAGSTGAQEAAAQLRFVAAFNIEGRDRGPFARARVPIGRLDPSWLFRMQTSGHYARVRYSPTTEWALSVARRIRGGPRTATDS
jgi:peptidoglycan/xylan/chitin deacetylase (PgdA/CDA1 family)